MRHWRPIQHRDSSSQNVPHGSVAHESGQQDEEDASRLEFPGPLDGDAPSSSASRAAPVSAFFVLVPIGLMSLFRVFRAVLRHVVTTLSRGRMLVITTGGLTVVA